LQKIIIKINELFGLAFDDEMLEEQYNNEYLRLHKEQNILTAKVVVFLYFTYVPLVSILIGKDLEKLLFISVIGLSGPFFLLYAARKEWYEQYQVEILFLAALLAGSAPLIMYNITTVDRTFFLVDILLPFFAISTMYGITFAFSFFISLILLLFFFSLNFLYAVSWDDFVMSAYTLASGVVIGFIAAYMMEKTARKLFVSQLHSKELKNILEYLKDAVAILDFESAEYLYANKAALEINGYSYEELMGTPLYVVHPTIDKKRIEQIKTTLQKEGSFDDVFELRDKNGNPYYIHAVIQLARYKGKKAVVITSSNVTKYKKHQMEIEEMAVRDQLTGLYNRYKFTEYAELFTHQFKRNQMDVSLLICDIDHFKRVNDTHGHLAGDAVLKQIANILQENTRESDIVARWGGEEFAVLLPMTDKQKAYAVAKKITQQLAARTFPNIGKVTLSCGVAQLQEEDTLSSWFMRADEALYKAKEDGRNKVVVAASKKQEAF